MNVHFTHILNNAPSYTKPGWVTFGARMERDALGVVREIFEAAPEDYLEDLPHAWALLALASTSSNAFCDEEGIGKAQLIDFCQYWGPLIRALRREVLGEEESDENGATERPVPFYRERFRERFDWEQVQTLLWSLADAVLTYKGPVDVPKFSIVSDLEISLCLGKYIFLAGAASQGGNDAQ